MRADEAFLVDYDQILNELRHKTTKCGISSAAPRRPPAGTPVPTLPAVAPVG
jgi:hypothetical protein